MTIRFRVEGDPGNIGGIFDILDDTIRDVGEREGRQIATRICNDFREDLVRHIEHQLFDHAELSAAYLRYKQRAGLDERILIATHEYLDHIQVQETDNGVGVGVTEGNHSGSNLEYDLLADYLEYGTGTRRRSGREADNDPGGTGMPPRPHWRPMVQRWEAKVEQLRPDIENRMNEAMIEEMRRRGYVS